MLTNTPKVFLGGWGDAPSDTKMYSFDTLPSNGAPTLSLVHYDRKSNWKGPHPILSSRTPLRLHPNVWIIPKSNGVLDPEQQLLQIQAS